MNFIGYIRVSDRYKQGRTRLGLDAQRNDVEKYVASQNGNLLRIFEEQETGRKNSRPVLEQAIEYAKANNCMICISRIDRLSRKTSFILRLIDDSDVKFHFCDFPNVDKMTLTVLAAVAERESDMISQRVKAAYAQKRKRGEALGSPKIKEVAAIGRKVRSKTSQEYANWLSKQITKVQKEAFVFTLTDTAKVLNARGIKSPTGKQLSPMTLKRAMEKASLN